MKNENSEIRPAHGSKKVALNDIKKEIGPEQIFHANYIDHEKELIEFKKNEDLLNNKNEEDENE